MGKFLPQFSSLHGSYRTVQKSAASGLAHHSLASIPLLPIPSILLLTRCGAHTIERPPPLPLTLPKGAGGKGESGWGERKVDTVTDEGQVEPPGEDMWMDVDAIIG